MIRDNEALYILARGIPKVEFRNDIISFADDSFLMRTIDYCGKVGSIGAHEHWFMLEGALRTLLSQIEVDQDKLSILIRALSIDYEDTLSRVYSLSEELWNNAPREDRDSILEESSAIINKILGRVNTSNFVERWLMTRMEKQ